MLDSKRILIIEDDEDYKRLLGAVLARSPEAFDVKTARSLAEGLALLKAFHPEIVLMDLDLPDSTGYETFLRVQAQAHEVPLIMLTALDDDSTAVQSVKDGAQDYLVKSHIQPKVIPRLINMALHRVKRGAERNGTGAGKPGHVIGFIGSKGGVGTSTTAVNVAAALAQSGSDTVVIELHSGAGTLSLYAKSEPAGGLKALLEKPADTITALDLEHHLVEAVRGVRLLCPGSSVIQTPIGVKHAHAIISAAKRVVPYVVLDLPARIDEGVAAALKLCDCLALVIDREPSSVHCGAAALQQIESVISPNVGFGRIVIDRTVLDTPLPLEEIGRAHV